MMAGGSSIVLHHYDGSTGAGRIQRRAGDDRQAAQSAGETRSEDRERRKGDCRRHDRGIDCRASDARPGAMGRGQGCHPGRGPDVAM